jgi:hypothetical protein
MEKLMCESKQSLFTTILNVTIVTLSLYLTGCSIEQNHFSLADFYRIEKVDSHVHMNSSDTAFIEQARADNFRLLTVNVDYPDFPPLEIQEKIAITAYRANSDIIAFASTFHMAGWDKSNWQARTITHLDSTFLFGSIAVKFWKNIGMEFRDSNGNLIMIDNPKFDPIFSHLRLKKMVVIGHMGEPKSCWLPLEKIPINYIKQYFLEHPQYHMYLHPDMPSYEDQIQTRDRMLEKNEGLVFVAAHLASLEWSVDEIGNFLDRFPNSYVDLAARMSEIQYQSRLNRTKVRQFFNHYQDHILYGSDLVHSSETDPTNFKKEAHDIWFADWKYFNTDSILTNSDFPGSFQGLALPKQVVEKIYRTNTKKVFEKAWKS